MVWKVLTEEPFKFAMPNHFHTWRRKSYRRRIWGWVVHTKINWCRRRYRRWHGDPGRYIGNHFIDQMHLEAPGWYYLLSFLNNGNNNYQFSFLSNRLFKAKRIKIPVSEEVYFPRKRVVIFVHKPKFALRIQHIILKSMNIFFCKRNKCCFLDFKYLHVFC